MIDFQSYGNHRSSSRSWNVCGLSLRATPTPKVEAPPFDSVQGIGWAIIGVRLGCGFAIFLSDFVAI